MPDDIKVIESGTCRHCGCTDTQACSTDDGPCHWMDMQKTICSNPECVAAEIGMSKTELYREQMSGALLDAARTTARSAYMMLAKEPPMIIGFGGEPTVGDCIMQAIEWLDAARMMQLEQMGTPPTSIHVVKT